MPGAVVRTPRSPEAPLVVCGPGERAPSALTKSLARFTYGTENMQAKFC